MPSHRFSDLSTSDLCSAGPWWLKCGGCGCVWYAGHICPTPPKPWWKPSAELLQVEAPPRAALRVEAAHAGPAQPEGGDSASFGGVLAVAAPGCSQVDQPGPVPAGLAGAGLVACAGGVYPVARRSMDFSHRQRLRRRVSVPSVDVGVGWRAYGSVGSLGVGCVSVGADVQGVAGVAA